MTKCRDCEQRIIWAEDENGKRVAIDPAPNDDGRLETIPTHPDAPLRVKVNPRAAKRYIEHFKTCPESDYEEREPQWVREPEGY